LFPKVLAISGKTLMVSSAGNMTTILEASPRTKLRIGGVVDGSRPKRKPTKFRLIEDRVPAPK
jgi:hypothetical protein